MGINVSYPEPAALARIADALQSVGVAGNEGDRFFDGSGLDAVRPVLERRLQEAGRHDARLALRPLAPTPDGIDLLVYDEARFAAADDAERAWEDDYRARRKARIASRVRDWLERLEALRTLVGTCIAADDELSRLRIVARPPVVLDDEPMRRFGVAPVAMPSFDLCDGARRICRFLPKGLWVIGANGRVDLVGRQTSCILVDEARPLSGFSSWQMFFSATGERRPLDGEGLTAFLRANLS